MSALRRSGPVRYHVDFIEGSSPPTWRVTKLYLDARTFPQVFDVVDGDVARALAAHSELVTAVAWALSGSDEPRIRVFLSSDTEWQSIARAALARARGEA